MIVHGILQACRAVRPDSRMTCIASCTPYDMLRTTGSEVQLMHAVANFIVDQSNTPQWSPAVTAPCGVTKCAGGYFMCMCWFCEWMDIV
jgi:hypothetical protein